MNWSSGRGNRDRDVFPWVLTFEQMLRDTPFVADMRDMLKTFRRLRLSVDV